MSGEDAYQPRDHHKARKANQEIFQSPRSLHDTYEAVCSLLRNRERTGRL